MIIFWASVVAITAFVLAILLWPTRLFQSRKISIFLAIALPAFSLLMYVQWGKSSELSEYLIAQAHHTNVQDDIEALGSLENIIAKMEEQVHIHQDPKGWFLLGRLYMRAEQFDKAVDALKKSNQLLPDQVETLIAYAEAIYFSNNQEVNHHARLVLQQVLNLDPNQPDALNLSAVDAYQRGDYEAATDIWRKLLAQLPEGNDQAKAILATIEDMQK